jgi:hypothetical protein
VYRAETGIDAALTDEMKAEISTAEARVKEQLSGHWLKSIGADKAYNEFRDPEKMFLTRPQRLKLENLAHEAYYAQTQASEDGGGMGRASKPAPFWSLLYTDKVSPPPPRTFPSLFYAMPPQPRAHVAQIPLTTSLAQALLDYAVDEVMGLGKFMEWDGPRSLTENREELARHEGDAFKTVHYFLTRRQRRELELQVELGFKREKPHGPGRPGRCSRLGDYDCK